MKTVIYILAILVAAGAAFFTFKNIELHKNELKKTTKLEEANTNLRSNIKGKNGEVRIEKEARDDEQEEKDGLEAQIRVKEKNKKDYIAESASYDDVLSELATKKKENDDVLAKIIATVKGVDPNMTIDKVPGHFKGLKDEKKKLNSDLGKLEDLVKRRESEVAQNKARITDLLGARDQRRKNLKSNGVSSLITTVDNDWGFVVIKPHPDAIIKQDSQLIVIRGSRHIGRLSINAIEKGGRVLANIDYKSLVAGMRIRSGDRVILSKSVTN